MKKLLMICLTLIALSVEAKKEKPKQCKPSGCYTASHNNELSCGQVTDGYLDTADGPISPAPTYVINMTTQVGEVSIRYAGQEFPTVRFFSTELIEFGTRPGHRLFEIIVEIPAIGLTVRRTTNSNAGGFFALRRSASGQFYIDEFVRRSNPELITAYIVNVTGFEVVDYTIFHTNIFCANTPGRRIPNLDATIARLGTCAVTGLVGRVASPEGTVSTINRVNSSGRQGVYIFKQAPGLNSFEAVGPFRFN